MLNFGDNVPFFTIHWIVVAWLTLASPYSLYPPWYGGLAKAGITILVIPLLGSGGPAYMGVTVSFVLGASNPANAGVNAPIWHYCMNVIQIDDGRKHQLDLKKLCSMRWKVDRALVSPSKITNHLNEL